MCPARRDHRRQRLVPAHGRGRPPREQDVLRSIDVPVVSVTTPAAHPYSYSKHVQTCGSRAGPTAAACSRCVSLVDDLYAPAGLLALVLQLRLEHPPAGIEYGLGHPRLRQPGTAHIAHDNGLIGIDQVTGKSMQGVMAAGGRGPVQSLGLAPMTAALGLGDLRLEAAVKPTRLELLPIAGRGRRLEPQIDADRRFRGHRSLDGHFDWNAQPPVADRVLGEATGLPYHALEALCLEHAERLARKTQTAAFALDLCRFARHPTERTARPAAHPPAQFRLLELSPAPGELRIHPLNRVRADVIELGGGARGELIEVIRAQPFARSREWARGLESRRVRPVPHLIDLCSGGVEPT